MRRLVSKAARAAVSVAVGLLILAVLGWAPVYARQPVGIGALSLFAPVVVLAVVAALHSVPRRPGPWRAALGAGTVLLALLAGVVAARGPGGLAAQVEGRTGLLATLPRGPIDLVPSDLAGLDRPRRVQVSWAGELDVPGSGPYRLRAEGRGRVELRLDGRRVLAGEGEPLDVDQLVALGRGTRRLDLVYEYAGPAPRLWLEWTPPAADGRPGLRSERVSPRHLGTPAAPLLWTLTDALAVMLAGAAALLVLWLPWEAPTPLPAPTPIGGRETALSLLGHLALVALMSWPLVTDLAGSGPFGQPDGRLNAWILAWDVHALRTAPGSLFQAPIFHPLPDTLAFSENLLLPAVLTAPLQVLGGPALAYNVALLLGYAVSGLAVQLLVRRATRDSLAGFVGGALFANGIQRWINMAHLHVQLTPFLPLTLLALDRFWQRRTPTRAALVGLCLALQGAASINLSVIAAVVVAAVVVLFVWAGLRGRELALLLGGLAAGAALLVPLARPYLRMRAFQGEEFGLDYVAGFAATLESYAASAAPFYSGLGERYLDPERVRGYLFPGLVPIALGLAGLARAPRRFATVAVVASGVAVLLSLGPETPIYGVLHEHLALLRGLRALFRFSVVPVLALCVLAGCALAGRRRLALAALVLGLLESWNGPFAFSHYAAPSATARALASGEGPVAHLPLGERDTEVMRDGIAHFRPLVNGDSGFMPRGYSRAMELLNRPLDEEALRLLRAFGVQQVVAREAGGLEPTARFGEEAIFEVPAGPSARAVVAGTAWPTVATPDGFVVDLGETREVGRVDFELSEAAWLAAPRLEISADGREWRAIAARASLADATASLYADPRHGRGELRFAPQRARYLRLDSRLPARPGAFGAGS